MTDAYDWDIKRCRAYAEQLRDKTRANTAEHAAQAIEWLLAQLASHQIIGKNQEPMACQHKRYSIDVTEQIGTCIDCGSEGRMRFVVDDTHPLKREWVGLTEFDRAKLKAEHSRLKPVYYDERNNIDVVADIVEKDALINAIEQALKEKNT
jgi:hypothetical protein